MKRRLSGLLAACGVLLAAQVATARADAPQPPVTPTVPTVAVQAAIAIAAAPTRLGAGRGPDRYERAEARPAAQPEEHVRDNRLLLQLGVLGAFLYLACLAGWFCVTRLRRTRT